MTKQIEITISGVGGQGMILCGSLIAETAVMHEGHKATLSTEYGVETRGTFSKADVIVSDSDIYFPDVTNPDVVVCLAQVAYQRYTGKLPETALLLYNSDEVHPDPALAAKERGIPISSMVKELGNPAASNILTMGVIAGYTGINSRAGARDALKHFFGHKGETVLSLNFNAFELGYQTGLSLK